MNCLKYYLRLITGLIGIILLPWGGDVCHAGNFGYGFSRLNIDKGLSANHVKALIRDRYGFVWVGTSNGLNRYDGANVVQYTCYDPEKQHGNNNIGALYEDRDGVIWIGTDRGVYRYLPENGGIEYVDMWDKTTGGLNWVQRIVGDNKGNVWVLVPDQGIFRKSGNEGKNYTMPSGSRYKEEYFNDICIDRNGQLWACSSNGKVFRFDKGYDEMVEVDFKLPSGIRLARIVPYDAERLIVADESAKVWMLYPENGFRSEECLTTLPQDLYLRSVAVVDHEVWLATQNGIYVYNLYSNQLSHYTHSLTDLNSLSDNTVYTLYADKEKNLWIGTMFGGVNYSERQAFHFNILQSPDPENKRIRGLALTSSHHLIIIGSVSAGINIFNISSNSFTPVPSPLNIKNPIMCVSSAGNQVMVGPDRKGLWVYEEGKTPYQYLPGQLSQENTVYSYLRDSRGTEWVGLSYALFRRMAGEEKFERVEETEYQWIFALTEDSEGKVWIGTMGTGLYKYDASNDKFHHYYYDDSAPKKDALRSNSINAISEDREGNIWISTDRGGLSRYNKSTDNFTTFGMKEGLPDNVVYPVLEDKKGRLWFGTNRGLVCMNKDGENILVFTKEDGLPSNEFTYHSAISVEDSEMYFGTVNGVVRFNPAERSVSSSDFPLIFTLMNVPAGDDVKNGLSSGSILHSGELSLPYSSNSFSLTVGVPSAIMLKGTKKYYYRLHPGKDEWIPMEDNRISFTHLAYGSYELEVKMECGEIVSQNSIRIVIHAPWWTTGWAICGYVVILIVIIGRVFVWYRNREMRRLRERQEIFASNQEKEVYRQKLNFFTEIAHEIRTPLSLIDLPLEAMEEKGLDSPEAEHYLKVTRQNTSRLLELTSQLLDFQKVEAGKLRLKKEAVDISEFINFTLDRFEPAISLKNKTLRRNVMANNSIIVTDKEALTKIISNLLNNALKYALSTISVAMEIKDGILKIRVGSDGEKIGREDSEHIFETFYQTDKSQEQKNGVGIGLPLSRSLARLLGGDLYLEENKGEDNIFVLSLPVEATEGVDVAATSYKVESSSIVYEEDTNQTPLGAKGYHVLIVEDNDGIRSMLNDRLSSTFLLTLATNGREALEILSKKSVDVVVSDIMMPEMDGLELCRQMKANVELSHIPIVFITAKNDLESKVKGLQCGAEGYIEKPFSVKYLREMVVSLLENRRRAREAFARKPLFEAANIPVNKEDEKFMEQVLTTIKENMADENFNVEALGEKMCMSRSNLLRHVKAVFNLAPGELIRVVRLKSAAELIRTGRYTLGEISQMIGISSQSYFTKMFHKQFNVMPNEFAKQVKSEE